MRKLAQKRLQTNLQQSLKYLVLVFNDFFILALIFLFGALMFWYAQAMKTMPSQRWFYRPLVGAILWLPLLVGKLATMLKPADLQFLLPQDKQIENYLKPMFKYSLVVPGIILILLAGILFPFATIKAKITPLEYLFGVMAVFVAKILQLKMMEHNLFFNRKISISAINLVLLLTFILGMIWPTILDVVLFLLVICVVLLILKPRHEKLFDWQYAVELEQRRKNRVYGAFSMFTDVKEKKVTIKRRKYLDFLLPKSLARENPNRFLYRRSLLRNPENINLLVRMTVFAVLVSWLVQDWLWALVLSCLVVFLTVYQLLPMANEFDSNIMYRISPIKRENRGKDLVNVLALALLLQWLVISLCWLLVLPIKLTLLKACTVLLVFSLLIGQIYLPAKIKKRKI